MAHDNPNIYLSDPLWKLENFQIEVNMYKKYIV